MKRINSLILCIVIWSLSAPLILQGQPMQSQGAPSINTSPTPNFSLPRVAEQQPSPPAVIMVEPCAGESPSNPYRSGMFQYEGDFERFVGASHGLGSGCVTTQFNTTHAMATLQDNTCLTTSWKVSHGTPEVCVDGTYPNHFIHLWSGNWTTDGDTEGEGIFYDCPLNPCKYYDISVKLSATQPITKIFFYLAKNLQHRATPIFNGEDPMYHVPNVSTLQLIHTVNNFSTGYSAPNGGMIWAKITIPVFKPIGPDMKLWIYTEDIKSNVGENGVDILCIDEVTDGIQGSNGTCDGSVSYTTSAIPAITTKKTISASGGAQIIAGRNVEFDGGESISLLPGFRAIHGSNFIASIVPCVTSGYCPPSGTQPPAVMTTLENSPSAPTIYPNPARDIVYIEKSNRNVLSVKLFDQVSNIEHGFTQYSDLGDKIRVGIDHLKTGNYIIVIKTSEGTFTKHLNIMR